MSEYERGYREALKAAAQIAEDYAAAASTNSEKSDRFSTVLRLAFVGCSERIRALASRIAAPSDEKTLRRSYADPGRTRTPPAPSSPPSVKRGVLRHE